MKIDAAIWFAFGLLVIAMCVAVTGVVPGFRWTATKYAPGYSEAAFRRVQIGDSVDAVFKAVGQPRFHTRYDNAESVAFYTSDSWTIYSQRRIIWFSNDVVTTKVSDVYAW